MPQRTSKILLVRLTANRNALLFLIRVTSFAPIAIDGAYSSKQKTSGFVQNAFISFKQSTHWNGMNCLDFSVAVVTLEKVLHGHGQSQDCSNYFQTFSIARSVHRLLWDCVSVPRTMRVSTIPQTTQTNLNRSSYAVVYCHINNSLYLCIQFVSNPPHICVIRFLIASVEHS